MWMKRCVVVASNLPMKNLTGSEQEISHMGWLENWEARVIVATQGNDRHRRWQSGIVSSDTRGDNRKSYSLEGLLLFSVKEGRHDDDVTCR